MQKIFQQAKVGPFTLKNAVVLASLTRLRCGEDGVPTDIVAEYYRQRAESAGLVLSEASPIEMKSNTFIGAAGLENETQAHAWKKVTDLVHKEGSFMFAQLVFQGRVLHPKHHGTEAIGPSAVPAEGFCYVRGEKVDYAVPREMTQEDIDRVQERFVNAAKMAKLGGFDGVELHAANGYLIDQFLKTASNKRTDKYGGSIENRCRFLLETIDKVAEVYPLNQIGVKLSPVGRYQSMNDENPLELFTYLMTELDKKGLAYAQLRESDTFTSQDKPQDAGDHQIAHVNETFRKIYKGTLMANGFRTGELGAKWIEEGTADLACFGWIFISNPDLTERLRNKWPIADVNAAALYKVANGSPAVGYSDYPKYEKK